jgi:hypothetical protein
MCYLNVLHGVATHMCPDVATTRYLMFLPVVRQHQNLETTRLGSNPFGTLSAVISHMSIASTSKAGPGLACEHTHLSPTRTGTLWAYEIDKNNHRLFSVRTQAPANEWPHADDCITIRGHNGAIICHNPNEIVALVVSRICHLVVFSTTAGRVHFPNPGNGKFMADQDITPS